jgi:hypothetical protein
VGGSALQWFTVLEEDLVPGSVYDVTITVGKVGSPVSLAWEIIVADASEAPAMVAGAVGC